MISTRRVRRNIARSERSELRDKPSPITVSQARTLSDTPIQGFGILSDFPEFHCDSLRAIFLCTSGAFLEAK